jgi:uncharacterized protein (DUF983 family)
MIPDIAPIKVALACRCPRCRKGRLYKSGLTLVLKDKCGICELDLSRNDSADGPAVFLIFVLGFALVPLALAFEALVHPPLLLHVLLWGTLALAITLGALRPLKAYIIALQFKYRPEHWE